MKQFKSLVSLVLVAVMSLALVGSAMAAESYPITITNSNATADHTYTGYQVFAGTLSENASGNKVLANITWGNGVNGDALLTELKTKEAYASCVDAAAVAEVLKGFSNNSAELEAFAEIVGKHLNTTNGINSSASADHKTYTINATAAGYYIVKETGINPETNRSSSGFIVNVVGPTEMAVKDTPMIPDKNILKAQGQVFTKVKEDTANVGDTVTFVVDRITVPSTDGYKTFKFVMKDTLPKGLTFGQVLSVKLDKNGSALSANDYTVTTSAVKDSNNEETGETELRIAFKNALTLLKPYEGKEVEIKYTATVNKDANFGATGNENEVVFEFTNNPDDEHTGDDFGPNEPHGVTPKSKTKTYVTLIKILKVDENGNGLDGAVFTLNGSSKNVVVTTGDYFKEDAAVTEGHYYLLKDGTYTLTAPQNGTADKYEYTNKTYSLESYTNTELQGANDVDITGVVSGGTDHSATFAGLKPGTYTITETGAPVGYNKITAPIVIDIEFSDLRDTKFYLAGNNIPAGVRLEADGTITISITNKSGAVLPSTGGIGTTIFYVAGIVLVLGAAAIIIARRKAEQN